MVMPAHAAASLELLVLGLRRTGRHRSRGVRVSAAPRGQTQNLGRRGSRILCAFGRSRRIAGQYRRRPAHASAHRSHRRAARAVQGTGCVYRRSRSVFKSGDPMVLLRTETRPIFLRPNNSPNCYSAARAPLPICSDFAAPIHIDAHDIRTHARAGPAPPQVIHQEPGLTIRAIPGHHGDAPAVIYRVSNMPARASPSPAISMPKPCPPCSVSRTVADLLVVNTVVLDPPGSAPILYTLHTPPKKIGELAHDAEVKQLLLSHLSPSTDHMREAVLQSIRLKFTGSVQLAQDGMRLSP